MNNMFEEFLEYFEETFGREYNCQDVTDLTYLAIFEAGWDAGSFYTQDRYGRN